MNRHEGQNILVLLEIYEKQEVLSCNASLLFSVFNWIPEREDSPKRFPLSAEVQWCEAAVVPLMKHPAPRCLQQSPANLHAAPLSRYMERCRPLLVNCVRSTSLKQGSQLCPHYLIECDLSFPGIDMCFEETNCLGFNSPTASQHNIKWAFWTINKCDPDASLHLNMMKTTFKQEEEVTFTKLDLVGRREDNTCSLSKYRIISVLPVEAARWSGVTQCMSVSENWNIPVSHK